MTGTPGENGWYRSDVTVTWTVEEPESPATLQTSGCEQTTIAGDTGGTTLTCEATSAGGNASDSVTIRRDASAPSIAIEAPTATTYDQDQAVAAVYGCSDGSSGVGACTGPMASGAPIDTAIAGAKTFTVTASDHAGNTNSRSVDYTVAAPPPEQLPPDQSPPDAPAGGPSGRPGGAAAGAPSTLPGLLPGACANQRLGSAARDLLDGSAAGDTLRGLAGNDRLTGLAGRDCLFGGAGNDRLAGGAGNDRLAGNGGNDRVSGGAGNDTLAGGAGDDKLSGGRGTNTISAGGGDDVINAANGKPDRVDCGYGTRPGARRPSRQAHWLRACPPSLSGRPASVGSYSEREPLMSHTYFNDGNSGSINGRSWSRRLLLPRVRAAGRARAERTDGERGGGRRRLARSGLAADDRHGRSRQRTKRSSRVRRPTAAASSSRRGRG